MRSGVIPSAELGGGERRDAKFHLLMEEHRPAYDELMSKYTLEEVVELAKRLPYHQSAANSVSMQHTPISRTGLFKWFDDMAKTPETMIRKRIRFHQTVSVYVAATSQWTASRVLTEVLELSKQKHALLIDLKATLNAAKAKGAERLVEAFQRKD